ncbi:MAG: bifunctional diguanylate cyclase/phosphodiesterase [Janthinobacterium lividum]
MRLTLGWTLICLGLISVLWYFTLAKASEDRLAIRDNALRHATSLSKAYAEQLSHSLQQIDQMALSLKLNWEENKDAKRLENNFEKGLFSPTSKLYATVADRNGNILSSNITPEKRINVATRDYFQIQKNTNVSGLLITKPVAGIDSDKLYIHFSRRLETSSGEFDGVVVIAVEPFYLASFYDEGILGKNDFLTVLDQQGDILASKPAVDSGSNPRAMRPLHALPAALGVSMMGASDFADQEPRIISWNQLESYPLTAMVGLSENGIYADYRIVERTDRNLALAGTVLLLVLQIVGVYLIARLAWRKQQAEDVRSTYHLAVDGAREGFYMGRALYDSEHRLADFLIEDCNERGAQLLGQHKSALVGTRFLRLYTGTNAHHFLDIFARAMDSGFYEDEIQVSPKGPLTAAWLYRRLVRSGDGIAMTVRDISDLKQHEQDLSDLANRDTLTGLPNRYWLMNHLPLALEKASSAKSLMALLFVDLDDFKNINDSLGHGAGDELLMAAAQRLKSLMRASDKVVRLGGDEFTVLLSPVEGREEVARISRQIVRALAEPFVLQGQGRHLVRASLGISMFPRDGQDKETLLKHADIAMYAAKASGKARYEFYETCHSDKLLARINKEAALRQAIERDEFVVYYQPRVDTFNGDLCGMEALVRWIHPERGLLLPEEFIQVAEDTGLILQIGELVIDKTIAQLASWKALGLPIVPVSINVSALQFDEGLLRPTLSESLARHRIAANMIEIEITESSMMGGGEEVSSQLTAIQALGIKLLVDDFGTGYSSLSQLQRLDMDVLKIDRAFTSQLSSDTSGNVLFKAIVAMAHALGMRVVAEGVETAKQLHVLQHMECNEIQGFLISRALPAADMPAIMKKRSLFPQPEVEEFQLA